MIDDGIDDGREAPAPTLTGKRTLIGSVRVACVKCQGELDDGLYLFIHFNHFFCLGCNDGGARRWFYLQPGPQQSNCSPWRGGLFFSFTALMVSATWSECCNPANVAINSNSISLAWGEIVMHFLPGLF